MISYLKCSSMPDLKNKMVFLYVLNVTDIIFTLILCGTGACIEANPFAALFVGSPAAALLMKGLVPAALLTYLYLRLRKASDNQRKKANVPIAGLLVAYALINISHVTWLSVLVFNPSVLV